MTGGGLGERRGGYEGVVRGVFAAIHDDYPDARLEPWDDWGVMLVFGAPCDVLPIGMDLAALRSWYARLIRRVLLALFDAEPDRPLGRLMTRLLCTR